MRECQLSGYQVCFPGPYSSVLETETTERLDPNLLALPREEGFIAPAETLTSMVDFDPSKYGLSP